MEIVRALLESNADVNSTNRVIGESNLRPVIYFSGGPQGLNILLFQKKTSSLHVAARMGFVEVAKELLKYGANATSHLDEVFNLDYVPKLCPKCSSFVT